MANAVLHRVWEHSKLRGATRCLMLLLADVADQRGIAYPGIPHIAKMICETEDYTDTLIKKAVKAGELFKIAGKGRGHVTRFAVLCGLNDLQIAQIKGVLQDPFSIPQKGQSSTPIPENKRGKVTPLKGVLQSDKRGTLLGPKQVTFEAYEYPATPLGQNEIHHDPTDPGGGGGDTRTLAFLENVGIGAAAEFASLSYEPMRLDYENRRADHQTNAIIVKAWRRNPPTEAYHYEQRPTIAQRAPDAAAQRKPSERIGERPTLPAGLRIVGRKHPADAGD